MMLTAPQQAVVDALARQGASLAYVSHQALCATAQELGWSERAVRLELADLRRDTKPHRATGKPRGRPRKCVEEPVVQTGLLPEAPILPLGCTDERVIARCQRGRPRR